MSYPSFQNYLKTLRSLLKRKSKWLLEESVLLADLCLAYGSLAGLSDQDKKTLFLAAHFKNLGALYLNDVVLRQEFEDHGQMIANMNTWFAESTQLAKDAGLKDVAVILEEYHRRAIPQHPLAKVFQVINAWVACRQQKGWRESLSEREALIILKQRAQMEWSDPDVVSQFIDHICDSQGSDESRAQACLTAKFSFQG